MKFLIDGHRNRVNLRREQWEEGILGQLLTPLTRYSLGEKVFAIDNGAYTSFREQAFIKLLKREEYNKNDCLFVAVPDKVGCHRTTLKLYEDYKHLCQTWKKAFVAQDGFDSLPEDYDCLFIGGTDNFKESLDAQQAVAKALSDNKHVHIGRVNGAKRFLLYHELGAHTCDGSGVSRYDHMLPLIKTAFNERYK
jgi:hypothetical protein